MLARRPISAMPCLLYTSLGEVMKVEGEDSEVISIYYGAETTEEDAESLAAELEEAYPDCEVEVNMGGQPIYYYIISVE